ncbi:MAG: BACON domain-containing protein [Pyrinomonadaceae bacterium MAG19_C2-C3]|nr:BACON domain-containing protein [Pyrinomonadaceae bacterium MAG19_C2-C3]
MISTRYSFHHVKPSSKARSLKGNERLIRYASYLLMVTLLIQLQTPLIHGQAIAPIGEKGSAATFSENPLGISLHRELLSSDNNWQAYRTVKFDELKRLGVLTESADAPEKERDSSVTIKGNDGLGAFFPLPFSNGEGAYEYAFRHSAPNQYDASRIGKFFGPTLSGLFFGDTRIKNQLATLGGFGSQQASAVALQQVQKSNSASNPQLGLIRSLNKPLFGVPTNQYLGSPTYPGGFDINIPTFSSAPRIDPLWSGAGAGFNSTSQTVLSVLGYNSNSSQNFASQFISNLNTFSSPWNPAFTRSGGFRLFSTSRAGKLQTTQQVSPIVATPLEALEEKYGEIAGQQLQAYYSPDLRALRATPYKILTALTHTDPLYMYLSYELNTVFQQILTTRPNYRNLETLSRIIASYSEPPTSTEELKRRYNARLLYLYLSAQVEYECFIFLASNPRLASDINETYFVLLKIQDGDYTHPAARQAFVDLQERFRQNFTGSREYKNFVDEYKALLDEYPVFKEYLQLNQEVAARIPTFNNHPKVRAVENMTNAALQSQRVGNTISVNYQQYTNRVNEILAATNFTVEAERFHEQLNAQIQANPTYRLMTLTQLINLIVLQDYQKTVHDTVARCFATYGNACNPYAISELNAYIFSDNTVQLISNVGDLLEIENTFWYDFYNSSNYLDLEVEAAERIQRTLGFSSQNSPEEMQAFGSSVFDSLLDARDRFNQSVDSLPELNALQTARTDLTSTFQSDSLELKRRFERMGQIATQLKEGTFCTYSTTLNQQSFQAKGGVGTVNVTTQTACAWTATSGVDWIRLTPGTNTSGNGSVSYTLLANPSTVARTGTLTVAGKNITIQQLGRKGRTSRFPRVKR